MSRKQLKRANVSKDNGVQFHSKEVSILFGPYTIWVVIVLLLIAIWCKFLALIVVGTFLLILTTIVSVWKKESLKHIKLNMQLSRTKLFMEEEFIAKVYLNNDKWLPLIWLECIFPESKEVTFSNNESGSYTIRFLWLRSYQKIEWTLKGRAAKRGVYDIGKVTLRSGDGFRFAQIEQRFYLKKVLYVYPKLMEVLVPRFNILIQQGLQGRQGGFIEDPLLVKGTREYQPGDELRRFNWRATARTGKFQTNVFETITSKQLIIYIDVQGFVIKEMDFENPQKLKEYVDGKRKNFEQFLSIIASVALKYKEQGVNIGLASNALNYIGRKLNMQLPSSNLTPFLDELAKITQRIGTPKMDGLDDVLQNGKQQIPLFIFCLQISEGHFMWYERNKHKLSVVSFYYKEETEYSKKLIANAKSIDTLLM